MSWRSARPISSRPTSASCAISTTPSYEKQIADRGLAPVKADLDYLAHLKTKADVARAMASPHLGIRSVFDVGIGIDDKDPNAYSVNLSQSGLGMPDRDYYLLPDKAMADTREAYKKYLVDMMTLAGLKDADARAASPGGRNRNRQSLVGSRRPP